MTGRRIYSAASSDTVNASGVATVTIGPDRARETWSVLTISVALDGSTEGEARVYTGPVGAHTFLEGTYSGARDTSQQTVELILNPGEHLSIQWTGATVGATATARVRYALL